MFHGNVPSDSRIFEYCPRRIQLGWSQVARSLLARAIIAHLKTMESQLSLKRLALPRCSPSHIGASAIKPVWSEGSWKSLAIVLFIKTIAIKKGWGKCDQASARSILPWTNSRVLRLRAQGSILYLIPFLRMNLTWIHHFNHGGASGTLKRTTIKSHKTHCHYPRWRHHFLLDIIEKIYDFATSREKSTRENVSKIAVCGRIERIS